MTAILSMALLSCSADPETVSLVSTPVPTVTHALEPTLPSPATPTVALTLEPTSATSPTSVLVPAPASTATPTTTPTPEPTPTVNPTPTYLMQPHVFLRVVLVTEDWVPFSSAGGWTQAVPDRESAALRYYEATIWEETDSVHLYALPNDYDPLYGIFGDIAKDDVIAYREQHAISVLTGMPEEFSDERSEFLRRTFEDFAEELVERHPQAEHHLMFNGHGGPGGKLFEGHMSNEDTDSFLASWTRSLGRPLGVIDMGGPCNKGAYEDLANFCKHAHYYVASDLPNGGYNMDDWTVEKFYETYAETQYHNLFASNDTLEPALIERVNLRRKDYEYSRNYMTQKEWEQATYLYSCAAFSDFSEAFGVFLDQTTIPYPAHDIYQLMLDNSAAPELLGLFTDVIIHAGDNRDFFAWNVSANGMISPLERIYRRGQSQ